MIVEIAKFHSGDPAVNCNSGFSYPESSGADRHKHPSHRMSGNAGFVFQFQIRS
jgi:hypothetical protein